MDDLLRQSEQQARNAGPDGGTRPDLDAFVQPLGAQWNSEEPLGADAELGRSIDKVMQQLEWLKTQQEINSWDSHCLTQTSNELGGIETEATGLTPNGSRQSQQSRHLLVLHTGLSDWQQLASSIDEDTDLLLIGKEESGVQQISNCLERRGTDQAYASLLLLLPDSSQGQLDLGTDELSLETLSDHHDQLSQWKQGLSESAQIRLIQDGTSAALETLLQELATITSTSTTTSAATESGLGVASVETDPTASSVKIKTEAKDLLQGARTILSNAVDDQTLKAALDVAYGKETAQQIEPLVQRFINQELEPQLYRAEIDSDNINGAFIASHNLILVNEKLTE